MSTHNISFRWEISKISAFFAWKKHLICCYDPWLFTECLEKNDQTIWMQANQSLLMAVPFLTLCDSYIIKCCWKPYCKKMKSICAGAQHFLLDCMCTQEILSSTCTDVQANLSLCCLSDVALNPWLLTECPKKTLIRILGCTGWSWVFTGYACKLVGNVVPWLIFLKQIHIEVLLFLFFFLTSHTALEMAHFSTKTY